MVKLRNTAGQEYFKFWVDLENKKEKLFMTGEVQKWEVDFKSVKLTPEDVLKNKKVAKMLMLPGVEGSYHSKRTVSSKCRRCSAT